MEASDWRVEAQDVESKPGIIGLEPNHETTEVKTNLPSMAYGMA